jgi:uncharacterized RDD family membrane protein YckC
MIKEFLNKKDELYAGPVKRIASYLVDSLIIAAFSISLVNISRKFGIELKIYEQEIVLKDNILTLEKKFDANELTKVYYPLLVIDFLYFVSFMCSKKQATIGQQLFGIMVVHKKNIKITLLVALLRYVAFLIEENIYHVGLLLYFFRSDKALLQDILSDTAVINLVKN